MPTSKCERHTVDAIGEGEEKNKYNKYTALYLHHISIISRNLTGNMREWNGIDFYSTHV